MWTKNYKELLATTLVCALSVLFSESVGQAQEYGAYKRVGFMARDGSTAGYMDYLLPLAQGDNHLFFLNPKVSLTDDDANEQNLGFGYRRLSEDANRIMGINLFYDRRNTTHSNTFQQVGLGLEMLTKWFDYRINYYHPTSNARRTESLDSHGFGATAIIRQRGFEEPLRGLDWEVGMMIPKISKYVETRVYGGGFHYESKKFENRNGGRFRVELRPNKLFTLELKVDHVKGDDNPETSFGGYFTLPFEVGNIFQGKNPFEGWKEALSLGQGYRSVKERMTERVARDLDIVSKGGASKLPEDQEAVRENVIYVDNSNTTGTESGKLDSPFNTLGEAVAAASGGALIYVFKGDETATGYTGNFTVPDSVDVGGEGYDLGFKGLPNDQHPKIDGGGTPGNVLTLSGDSIISGLSIAGGATGISSISANKNITVRNNIISADNGNGVEAAFASGTSTINFLNNSVTKAAGNNSGLLVTTSSGAGATGNITISNNTVSGATSTGIEVRSEGGTTPTFNYTIDNNTVTSSGSGGIVISSQSAGATFSGTISNNSSSSNGSGGIEVSAEDNSTITATITGNSSFSNTEAGILACNSGTETVTISVSNNKLLDNKTSGFQVENVAGGTFSVSSFTNNSVRVSSTSGSTHLSSANSIAFEGGGNFYQDANSSTITASSSLSLGGASSGSITFNNSLLENDPN